MSNTVYIALAWIATFGVLAGYSIWVLRRGRVLSRQVPADQRRWMTDQQQADQQQASKGQSNG